jgi:2-methylcitrate dehydratase PrpD
MVMVSLDQIDNREEELMPTRDLGSMAANLSSSDLSENAIMWAKHCILDWIAVTVGGAQDELTKKIISVALDEEANGRARIVGHETKLVASHAALVNGAASHALDYDDVNARMNGHPTVPIVPVLMALSDEFNVTGIEFITAFIAGYEVETRLAEMSGFAHYDKGWHGTATYGTFGAAAAAAKLLGLDTDQTITALGIAATQAAGLKSMFGTMCKPLHAGKAASNGLLAARLAKKGFTSRMDAIECAQGFAATQADGFRALPVSLAHNQKLAVEENLFKYHASCYLTHAGIEAVKSLRDEHDVKVQQIKSVQQFVPKTHFSVCNIAEPTTGLETKFSMRHTAAMALAHVDTGSLGSYDDTMANREDLVALRHKIEIIDKKFGSRMQSEVVINLNDGRSLEKFADAGVPMGDLFLQAQKLSDKFKALVGPVYGDEASEKTIDACFDLDQFNNAGRIFDLVVGKG